MKTIIIMLLAVGILSCVPDAEQARQTEQPEQTEQTEQSGQTEQLDTPYDNFAFFNSAVFDAEKAAWKAQGIHSYRFTGQTYAAYLPTVPYTVTVLPDTEPEVIYDEWYQEFMEMVVSGKPFYPLNGATIDDFYDFMKKRKPKEGEIVSIWYDQKHHYPKGYQVQTPVEGGSFCLKITQFEVLGEPAEPPGQTDQEKQQEREKQWEQFRATFEAEKAAWKAQGIHHYRFTAQTGMPYPPGVVPITVTVLPDTKPEVTYDEERYGEIQKDKEASHEGRLFAPYQWVTIDDFYDTLHLSKPGESIYSIVEGIRYNQKYHYPEIYSEYIRFSDDPGGQYYDFFEITQFEVLGE